MNIEGLLDFAKKERIGLVVVGPENSLAAGIVDAFESQGIPIFGPSAAGARMETSKIFAKETDEASRYPYRTIQDLRGL